MCLLFEKHFPKMYEIVHSEKLCFNSLDMRYVVLPFIIMLLTSDKKNDTIPILAAKVNAPPMHVLKLCFNLNVRLTGAPVVSIISIELILFEKIFAFLFIDK